MSSAPRHSPPGRPLAPEIIARRSPLRKPGVGPLTDGLVRVEPYDEIRHLAAVHAAFCPSNSRPGFETEAVFDYLGKAAVSADTLEDTRHWIGAYSAAPDSQTFVVLVRQDAAAHGSTADSGEPTKQCDWHLAGTTSFRAFRPDDLVIEIGAVAFSPRFQRTPVNTAATRLLLSHAFDVLGCLRVEWKCNARNGPSRAAAERLGFTFEGIFRQHMIVKDAYSRDTAWFYMLAAEWPERQTTIAAFLASLRAATLFNRRRCDAEAAGVPAPPIVSNLA